MLLRKSLDGLSHVTPGQPLRWEIEQSSIQTGVLQFFLHEWRRCVCRLCASHLSRVESELQIRLRQENVAVRA